MKRKKKIDLLGICRIIFIAALFFLLIISVFQVVREGIWDASRRYTIAIDADPLLLFSIEPSSKQAILLLIPPDTVLDIPYGYNTYPAKAVYKLGQLDRLRGGGKLLMKGMENTFAVATEGFVAAKSEKKWAFPTKEGSLLEMKKNYFSATGLLTRIFLLPRFIQNIDSNIPLIDRIRLWLSVRSLRSDQITIADLSGSNVASLEKLADGTDAYIIDKGLFDQIFGLKFEDRQIRAQNISLQVINATQREKIAGQFSRILTNLGANVVAVSTSDSQENYGCKVVASRKELSSSIIIKRLKEFYNCDVEIKDIQTVSDLTISLGEDFLK